MCKIKYLLESVIGFIITSPFLEESIRNVLNYDNSLLFYKILFLLLFWIIDIVGYIVIIDGLTRLFLGMNFFETVKEIYDYIQGLREQNSIQTLFE